MFPKLAAESIGTFWLVLGGCGSAVLAAAFPNVGIGLLGVSLAFGLTVVSGAYALGPISGGHFNPAVSVGLWAGGRFPASQLLPYILAQVVGGIVGAGVLYLDRERPRRFQSCGRLRVQRLRRALTWRLFACGRTRVRSRDDVHVPDRHPRHHAQARPRRIRRHGDRPRTHADPSHQHPGDQHLGEPGAQHRQPALFVGGWAVQQLWLFWVAPIVGAAIAGFVHTSVLESPVEEPPVTGRVASRARA